MYWASLLPLSSHYNLKERIQTGQINNLNEIMGRKRHTHFEIVESDIGAKYFKPRSPPV